MSFEAQAMELRDQVRRLGNTAEVLCKQVESARETLYEVISRLGELMLWFPGGSPSRKEAIQLMKLCDSWLEADRRIRTEEIP